MSRGTSDKYLQVGIQNFRNDQRATAVQNFAEAVRSDPLNASAWYWLGQVIEDPEKKKYCHDRAIALDPKIGILQANPKELSDNFESAPTENKPASDGPIPSNPEREERPSEQICPVQSENQTGKKNEENIDSTSKGADKKSGVLFSFFVSMLIGFLILIFPVFYLVRSGFFDPYQPYLALFLPTPTGIQSPASLELPQSQIPGPDVILPTPGQTPVVDEAKNYALLQEKMNEAYQAYSESDFTTAISYFNEAQQLDPENAEIYARLGGSYYLSINGLRDYGEFSNYLSLAVENYDQAIKIDPTRADYYVWRGQLLEFIGLNQTFRVTRDQYLIAAQENLELGLQLGFFKSEIQPTLTEIHRYLGACDLSLQESEQLNEEESSTNSKENLALSYICLGKYQKALESVGENPEFVIQNYAQVKALYALGRYNEALAILNESIEKQPGYYGERYFWKALIEYQQGLTDQAWADLSTGEGNTWIRPPIFYYLYSKYLQDQGDVDQAKSIMQYAEASLGPQDGPFIAKMVDAGLKELGVEPLELDLEPEYPILSLPDVQTIQALIASSAKSTTDHIYYPEGYQDAVQAAFEDGTMAMRIPPRTTRLIHLSFKEPLDITSVQNLHIQIQGNFEDYQNLKMAVFMPNGGWRFYYPSEDLEDIFSPESYLFSDHDLYIALIDPDYNEAVFFYNFGITATVTLSDGSTRVIGYEIESQS